MREIHPINQYLWKNKMKMNFFFKEPFLSLRCVLFSLPPQLHSHPLYPNQIPSHLFRICERDKSDWVMWMIFGDLHWGAINKATLVTDIFWMLSYFYVFNRICLLKTPLSDICCSDLDCRLSSRDKKQWTKIGNLLRTPSQCFLGFIWLFVCRVWRSLKRNNIQMTISEFH